MVNALPVGRIDLKKAEEERKAAEEPVATKKTKGIWGRIFDVFVFVGGGYCIMDDQLFDAREAIAM